MLFLDLFNFAGIVQEPEEVRVRMRWRTKDEAAILDAWKEEKIFHWNIERGKCWPVAVDLTEIKLMPLSILEILNAVHLFQWPDQQLQALISAKQLVEIARFRQWLDTILPSLTTTQFQIHWQMKLFELGLEYKISHWCYLWSDVLCTEAIDFIVWHGGRFWMGCCQIMCCQLTLLPHLHDMQLLSWRFNCMGFPKRQRSYDIWVINFLLMCGISSGFWLQHPHLWVSSTHMTVARKPLTDTPAQDSEMPASQPIN